jgi:hypothetical protein
LLLDDDVPLWTDINITPRDDVQVMTASSVPSTLVKCLYLFFDLPEEGAGEAVASADSPPDNDNEFTPRERRILLQKMFMQVRYTDT